MKARLPSLFSFKSAKDLVRIGRDNDGGYLISQSDMDKTDFLVGLGIHDDWSFESDFVHHNNVPVSAYDASVNVKFFLKRIFISTIKNPFNFLYALKKLISYKFFFRENRKHIQKFVGLNCVDSIHCSLESIFNEIQGKNIFFKIDIEGSEYRFLDTLISNQNRISGLVMELHDCDLHLDAIKNFINGLDLKLVHIHANNHAPIRLDDGLPLVLELTFSRYCEIENEVWMPHKLDMPNNKNKSEIKLIIES